MIPFRLGMEDYLMSLKAIL